MKVLIVEDEEAGRKLISMMLAGKHQTHSVENVDEAINQLSRESWDVVLTDYKMPGKTGVDLVQYLQANDFSIPVVLMTGQGSKDDKVDLVKNQVHKVLGKPFDRKALLAVLSELSPATA